MGKTKVTITLERREDGGLRVWSDDVLGLILSHADPITTGQDIVPALLALGHLSAPTAEALAGEEQGG